jgi:hypothetical protein
MLKAANSKMRFYIIALSGKLGKVRQTSQFDDISLRSDGHVRCSWAEHSLTGSSEHVCGQQKHNISSGRIKSGGGRSQAPVDCLLGMMAGRGKVRMTMTMMMLLLLLLWCFTGSTGG